MHNLFSIQNQLMAFLNITSELIFESTNNSQSLQIWCKKYQTWTLYDLPNNWTASKTSGRGPQTITINAISNNSNLQIDKNIRIISGNKIAYCHIIQKAGYYTYAKPVITANYPKVSAAGGTYLPTVSFTQTYGWNGETSGAGTITSGGKWSFSGNLITNTANGEISVSSLGIKEVLTDSIITNIEVTLDINEQKDSINIDVYQEANLPSYETPTISSSGVDTIPASGGTVSVHNNVITSQIVRYTSTSERPGTVNVTYSTPVNAPSLGTTIKETLTKVGVLTVYANGEGGKVNSKSLDVYQEKNIIIDNNFNPHITTYGTPTISIGSGLTAAGGSATVSSSVSNIVTYYEKYSSNDTGPAKTRNEAGSVTLALTTNGNNRFSLSGTTITHSPMDTNLTTDTVTITSTNSGDSSKKNTASQSITNNRKAISTSGGVTTWEVVQIGSWSNKVIPASGGSATITLGDGSQNWSKTATITTYTYDSGVSNDEVTEQASSGTVTIKPDIASVSASAPSKGRTVSEQNLVKSEYITWEGKAPGTTSQQLVQIFQAKNDYLNVENLLIDQFGYNNIPFWGGRSEPAIDITYTAIYDSGRYDDEHGLPTLYNYYIVYTGNAEGFTLNSSSGTVTAELNTLSDPRDITITATIWCEKEGISNTPEISAQAICTQHEYQRITINITTSFDYASSRIKINFSSVPIDTFFIKFKGYDISNNIWEYTTGIAPGIETSIDFAPPGYSITDQFSIEGLGDSEFTISYESPYVGEYADYSWITNRTIINNKN